MKNDVELATLFYKVRKQEERNRLKVIIPLAILSVVLGASVLVAYLWYSQIVAILIFVVGALAFFLLRAEGIPRLAVSEVFVANRLDTACNLRGRISTLINLKVANDADKKLQQEILERQVNNIISDRSWDEKEIAPFTSVVLYKQSWTAVALASVCLLALLYFKPISVYDEAVRSIENVLAQNPQLPERVRKEAERLVAALKSEGKSVENILQVASDVESEIDSISHLQITTSSSVIEADSTSLKGAKDAQNNLENDTTPPTSIPEPHSRALDQKNDTTPPQEKQAGTNHQEQQEQRADQQGSDEAKTKQGAGTEQTGSQNSEEQKAEESLQKEEADKKGETQSEGEAEGQDSKENQDSGGEQGGESGDSQGTDKQEKGAQASAKQEGDGDGAGSGKGQSSEGEGQGEQDSGSSEGSEGMKGSASQENGGSKEGGTKNGEQGSADQAQTSDGTAAKDAMNQLQKAVSDVKEKLEKEQQSTQGQDSESSTNQGGAGGEKEQSNGDQTGEDDSSQQGSGGKDSQKDGDEKDSSEERGGNEKDVNDDKKSSDGEMKKNKGATSDKNDHSRPDENKDTKDKASKGATSQTKEPEQSPQKEAGENPADGSHSPDVDRDAKPRPGGYDENKSSSEGLGGDPRRFREIIREAEDEQLRSDQTTGEAQIIDNKEQARAKTSLEEIALAKPKPSSQRESQPIPLEYRGVLDVE